MKLAIPVPLGRVADTGETYQIPSRISRSEVAGQGLVDFAAALAIAPAGHDHGTGNHAGALLAGPADGFQESSRLEQD